MLEELENKEKYLLQPFVTGERVEIEIFLEKASPKAKAVLASSKKKVKLSQKILKDLKESYVSSKFKGYPICLLGILHTNDANVTSLVLTDIMLKQEKLAGSCSKRYSVRYENLVFRFLALKSKNVSAIFSQPFSSYSLGMFIRQFVETNKTDYAVMVKDSVAVEKEEAKEALWTYHRMKVVGYEEGRVKIRRVQENEDKNPEEAPEEELSCIDALVVQKDNVEKKIKLNNIPDAMKAQMLADLSFDRSSVIGKTCFFGEWKLLGKSGEVFFDLESN